MAPYLKCVITGGDLIGPDRADPHNGAEDAGVGPGQDPVLDGEFVEELVLVKSLVRIKILKQGSIYLCFCYK